MQFRPFNSKEELNMNTHYQAFLTTSSLTLATKDVQTNKTDANYVEKLYIIIIAMVLLLMAGAVSSANIVNRTVPRGVLTTDDVMDTIKADMQLNEAPLLKAPTGPGWTKKANIEMGAAPRGDATPYWWTPNNPTYKSSLPWKAISPWFVIYPGVDHAATNVRVKLYGIVLHILQKSTNQWKNIDTGLGNPSWASDWNFSGEKKSLGPAALRIESDGTYSYKLNTDLNPIHGSINRCLLYTSPSPRD